MTEQTKSKIILGARPETFAPTPIKFKLPSGADAAMTVTFRYRTRTEFGAFVAEAYGRDASDLPTTDSGRLDYEAMARQATMDEAAYVLGIVAGWDLDTELTRESAAQLADEVPAAVEALKRAYSAACNEGRLGN